MKRINILLLLLICCSFARAENGYDLWLRYVPIKNKTLLLEYKKQIASPVVLGSSATADIARKELAIALTGLTGSSYLINSTINTSSVFIAGTVKSSAVLAALVTKEELNRIGNEGFIIKAKPGKTFITGNTDVAVLYGIFHTCVYYKPINRFQISILFLFPN
jgi:alpha-glucuronidase